MLEIYKKKEIITTDVEQLKNRNKDIIVKRRKVKTTYKDNVETRKIEFEKINLTKKINESAKMIKKENSLEKKMQQIEKLARSV